MKLFLCMVILAVAAAKADEAFESPEAEASQAKTVILLQPKPTLAAYKPIPRAIKPIQPTYAPLKIAKPKAVVLSVKPKPLRPQPTLGPYNTIGNKVVPTGARKPIKPLQPTINQKGGAWWG